MVLTSFLFCGLLRNLSILAFCILLVDILYWIRREGFSGSLELCDLYTLGTIDKDESLDINSYDLRKNVPGPTLENSYDVVYQRLISSIRGPTLSPNPKITTSPSVPARTSANNYNGLLANSLSENRYITSPGMQISMTELPTRKDIGLSAATYDDLYKNTILNNQYNTS